MYLFGFHPVTVVQEQGGIGDQWVPGAMDIPYRPDEIELSADGRELRLGTEVLTHQKTNQTASVQSSGSSQIRFTSGTFTR